MKIFRCVFLVLLMPILAKAEINIKPGKGSFQFLHESKNLKVWYYSPRRLSAKTPVCFVMHGVKRNGEDYLDDWIDHAKKGRFLLLVPEFDEKNFPGSGAYNLGNLIDGSGKPNDPKLWSYTVIDEVFDGVVSGSKIQAEQYNIYGHSAGAQFVHRLALFCPNANIKVAISANAGWYTLLDGKKDFPYGVKGIDLSNQNIKSSLSKNLVILLGVDDTDPNHKYLRNTTEAKAQGPHRLARGKNFYDFSKKLALKLRVPFEWKLKTVSGVGHSNSGMSEKAIKYIK